MINLLNKQSGFLIVIFIIALSLRIGYAFLEKIPTYADATGYDKIGKHIAEGRGYRVSTGQIENDEAIFWPPGYAFFLGIIYRIFGHSHSVVWIIQSIIGAFICILIYLIANKLFDQKVAYISAVISTTCFNLVIYPAMLLTETLYLLLLLLCFIYLYKADVLNLISRYSVAGIFAGLAVLTRPIILIFFLFFSLVSLKKNTRGILLFLLPLILSVSVWIARNYYVYQRFIPISAGPGELFWAGHHLEFTGKLDMPKEVPPDPSGQEFFRIDRLGYSQGLKFITKYPLRTLLFELRKLSLFFSLIRTDGWWPHMKGVDRIFSFTLSLLFNLLIFGFGIIGIVFSYIKVNKYVSWMRRFIFISALSLIPFIVEARYRLIIYPFMIIFASYSLVLLPKIRAAFISQDKQIIHLSLLSIFLFALLVINSIYDLFTCADQISLRLLMLKSGIPNLW